MSVYFITCRDMGIVKIGIAQNPEARLASLQTSAPTKLKLEATLNGSRAEERALHIRFSEHRLHGEWFQITDEVDALIKSSGLQSLPDDSIAAPRRMTDEELVEESLRREHETYADCMAWRERLDHGLMSEAAA